MQNYYETWKRSNSNRISGKVIDPEGLLTGNGYGLEGVYIFEYVNVKNQITIPAYIGQAGKVRNAPSYIATDLYERILQHLKRMLGNSKYFEYWTGLSDNDNDWKIRVRLLQSEADHAKRLQLEEKFIDEKRPFLQDSKGGKFSLYPTKYGYARNDLAIHPWNNQRREAFLYRVGSIEKVG